MSEPKKTWIIIADGTQAHVLQYNQESDDLTGIALWKSAGKLRKASRFIEQGIRDRNVGLLILAGAPDYINLYRNELSSQARKRIAASIDKDLMSLARDEILDYMKDNLPAWVWSAASPNDQDELAA